MRTIILLVFVCLVYSDVINVLVISKEPTGKINLINNIVEKEIIKTDNINIHTFDINDIYNLDYNIKFIVRPSINDNNIHDIIYDISLIGDIDVVIICIDILEKTCDKDDKLIELMKKIFGVRIKNKIMLVYTNANSINNPIDISKSRHDATLNKNIAYYLSDNTKLNNYKIVSGIVNIGRSVKGEVIPKAYNLNKGYNNIFTKPCIKFYYFENNNVYDIKPNEKKLWSQVQTYIRYNMPYIYAVMNLKN